MLAKAVRRSAAGGKLGERPVPFPAKLEPIQLIGLEYVFDRTNPEVPVIGIVETWHAPGPAPRIHSKHPRPVRHQGRHIHGVRLEDAPIEFHAPLAYRLQHLSEKVVVGILLTCVVRKVTQYCVFKIFFVVAHPDVRKIPGVQVSYRNAVVRGQDRWHALSTDPIGSVIGVGVDHHRIESRLSLE